MNNKLLEDKEIVFKLVQQADVIVLYLNNEGNTVLFNQKLEDVTGLKQDELLGVNWQDVLFRNNNNNTIKKEMLKAVLDESVRYVRPKQFAGVVLDKEDNQRLISWSITPVLDDQKKIEGNLLIGDDITELGERETLTRKIDDSFKNIFSSIKDYALYVINPDGYIKYFAFGAESMLGWSCKDIIFKHVNILHTQEDAAKLHFILEHVRLFGKYEIEIDLLNRNSESIPVILTINQYFDSQGRLSGYIFIAKDITERRKMEYQIFQAEKLAALGQLSAGMAHEINNPLFVISGRLQMVQSQEKNLSVEMKESLELISLQTDRIRKLVDRILRFSRKSSPKLELIDINEIIEATLPLLFYHKLPQVRTDILKKLAENLPKIKADRNQLQEVFINLLVNAFQSMPQGGLVTIATSNFKDLFAQITITDTGTGVDPNNLKDIFMPFFSTKSEGTGLGLSICHNIIKNHNGTIEIKSQLNQGTTFTIKLPFVSEADNNAG